MAKGLKPSTQRKLNNRDNFINKIIRDVAAQRGLVLKRRAPEPPSWAQVVHKAGGRFVSVSAL